MKRCTKCGETKDESEFYKKSVGKNGLSSWCKACSNEAQHKKVVENPEKYKEKSRIAYRKNPGKYKEYGRRLMEKDPKKYKFIRTRLRLRRNGCEPSDNELNEFLSKRPPVCEICGRPTNGRTLNVDHDHRNRKLRGFLCNPCNRFLGTIHDDPAVLRRAIHYLETTWQERLKK